MPQVSEEASVEGQTVQEPGKDQKTNKSRLISITFAENWFVAMLKFLHEVKYNESHWGLNEATGKHKCVGEKILSAGV